MATFVMGLSVLSIATGLIVEVLLVLADSRVKFAKWSIVYFNVVLDFPVCLK